MCGLIPYSHSARIARRDEKRIKILSFLSGEIFVGADALAPIVNLNDRRAVINTLSAMERDKLLISVEINEGKRAKKLYGISQVGQALLNAINHTQKAQG